MKKEYPKVKKILWRFLRVFVATVLVTVSIQLPELQSANDWYSVLVLPALVAGLSALGKAVREYVASGDYDNLIHKLIV